MNTNNYISIISLGIFLLIIGLTTFFSNKKMMLNKSFESYLMGNRSFSWFFISLTLLGTYIGGGTLMGLSGKIGSVGIVYIFMPFGVSIAFLLFALFSKKYRDKGSEKVSFVEEDLPTSLVDRFSREYSEKVGKHIASFVLLIMVSFIAVQLRAGGIVISYIFDINVIFANFIVLVLVGCYIFFGGTRADILTDVIQVLIILVVLVTTFVFLLINTEFSAIANTIKSNTPNLLRLPSNSFILILGLLILPFFSIHTDSGIHQRVLIAKDNRNAKKALIYSSIIYLIFGIILVFLSIVAKSYDQNGSSDNLLLEYLSLNTPFFIQILFVIAILSAITSSIDSEAILFSTIFVNDIYKKIFRNNLKLVNSLEITENGRKENFFLAKSWTIIGLILGFSLTLTPLGLFDFLSIIWVISISAFSVPVIGLLSKFIKKGISANYLKFMLWSSVIIVICSSIYSHINGAKDLTTNSIQTAFAIFILFITITVFRSLFKKTKKS